jgi:hypothetical protein
MKKIWFVMLGLALIIFAITGCGKKEQSGQAPGTPMDTAQTTPKVQTAAAVYYCPMDTEIVSDKPGKCSKCGMDLIEKPAETK